MKRIIAIDCDGVLLDIYSYLTNKSKEIGINQYPYYVFERDNYSWSMYDVPLNLRSWAFQQFKNPYFIASIPFYNSTISNLYKIIKAMKNPKDFCIIFHTGISCDDVKSARVENIVKILNEIHKLIPQEQLPLFKFNIEKHKGALTDEHLNKLGLTEYNNFMIIDDKFKIIQDSNAVYKILVKQSHNEKDRNKINYGYHACDIDEIGEDVAKIIANLY